MGHMIFGNLGALIFWGVLALLIYVAVRATINRVGSDSKSNDPVDILRRRSSHERPELTPLADPTIF